MARDEDGESRRERRRRERQEDREARRMADRMQEHFDHIEGRPRRRGGCITKEGDCFMLPVWQAIGRWVKWGGW